MWSSLSNQQSAISNQQSAISNQQSPLKHLTKSFFLCLFAILTLTGIATAAPNSCFIYSIDDPASGFNEWASTRQEACQKYYKFVRPSDPNFIFYEGTMIRLSDGGETWTPVTDYDNYDSHCGVKYASIEYPLYYLYGSPKFTKWDYGSCTQAPTLIGYFNGVANTERTARLSLARLEIEFPSTTAKPIKHDLFYNQTGCTPGLLGKIDCVEDLVEVFQQYDTQFRQLLGNTGWEIFWEVMNGSYMKPGSYSLKLLSLIKFTPQRILLTNLIQRVAKSMMVRIGMHLVTLLKQPPTAADTAAHIAKLKTYADKGTGMVLMAHSQGNLFVNAAFDGIKASVPSAKAKVVHVGTAAPKLNGDYVLADIDIVINVLLRASVPLLPASNTPLTFNPVDLSGHQFEGSYLDKTRASYAKVVGMVNAALDGVR